MKNERLVFFGKCALSATLIFSLIFYAAQNAGSQLGILEFFIGVIGMLATLGIFLYLYLSIGAAFNQWMLNHGATDTDWLWFKSDPKGLESLRKKASEAA
jgi:hypothetical protein